MTAKKMLDSSETELDRTPWKNALNIDNICKYEKDNENYDYCGVIFTYRHLPNLVDQYEKAGYSVCYLNDNVWKDDRAFSTDNNDTIQRNRVPSPCINTTTDGHKMVLMKIPKEVARKYHEQQLKEYQGKYSASFAGDLQRNKGHVHIKGTQDFYQHNPDNKIGE